jgi:hypothetical protein
VAFREVTDMQVIPVQAIPNQKLQVFLVNQSITINIYQLAYGLFMDVYVGNSLIVAGVICENLNRIIRDLYLGFVGDFVFIDGNGTDTDPVYTGLGAQYQLLYLETTDLPAGSG